jgi:hypothetical protein
MKHLALLAVLVLTSCATITFHGNGYTAPEHFGQMAALRCAEVTLEHGYRYFIPIGVRFEWSDFVYDTRVRSNVWQRSRNRKLRDRNGDHHIHAASNLSIFQTGANLTIKMSNNAKSLEPYESFMFGHHTEPKDAAFLYIAVTLFGSNHGHLRSNWERITRIP